MYANTIDTLQITKRLQSKGANPELAEEFAEIMKEREEDYIHNLATKDDIEEVKNQICNLDSKFEEKVSNLDFKFEEKLSCLESKFEEKFSYLDSKLEERFSHLDFKLEERFSSFDSKFEGKISNLENKINIAMYKAILAMGVIVALAEKFIN